MNNIDPIVIREVEETLGEPGSSPPSPPSIDIPDPRDAIPVIEKIAPPKQETGRRGQVPPLLIHLNSLEFYEFGTNFT